MKIPYIFNIQRFSIHDGPGIRTTVFFKGCPMRCLWCHNPESQSFVSEQMINENGKAEIIGTQYTVDELVKILEKDQIFYDQSDGGVTLSGGEVLTQDIVYLTEITKKLHNKGISVVVDTCGHVARENIAKILPYTDLFLYDLKAIDSSKHLTGTGVENELVLENLKYLNDCGAKIILRLIMIGDFNMELEDIDNMIFWLKKERIKLEEVNLLPYHDFGRDKYKKLSRVCTQNFRKPNDDELKEVENKFIESGFRVKIGG